MKKYSTRIISDSGILVVAMMLSNGLNFVYNAYLGRVLSFEDFGLVTLVNTFLFITSMFLGAFGSTINHRVSYLIGAHGNVSAINFFRKTRKGALLFVVALTALWFLLSNAISGIFNIADPQIVMLFSPVFILLVYLISARAYLQGSFAFGMVALLYLTESISKLVSVFVLVSAGQTSWSYISIPFSILCTAVVCALVLLGRIQLPKQEVAAENSEMRFPFSFYFASIFSGLSTTAFLSIDVLLAKHFLSPTEAGEYALLSLVGKMVFFLGSLFNTFINTFVSRDLGKGKSPKTTFYTIFALESFFALSAFALFGPLGSLTVPLLFGAKSDAIIDYLTLYAFGIALFTLSNTIVSYRLILHHYVFPVVSIFVSIGMFVGILVFHGDVATIARVVAYASIAGFMLITLLHVVFDQGRFILRNLIDLFDLFSPVGNESEHIVYKKRILIFNWRDIKHIHAGGAEVYIHELSKQWVTDGYKVTLFCGNDGKCPRYEEIDGVEIVRRGGFYFVYVWAFLYYLFKFRGKYDAIIDCENGIPFFTPLYTREPQYLVIHHVHQDVFSKSLLPPFSYLANYLESRLMPYVYENVKIITVSPSSKEDILSAGIGKGEIDIVYNGVDLDFYVPTKKNERPIVLYLGRLKSYKSVDIFIKAAAQILEKVPDVLFKIAGDGDDRKRLEQLVRTLGITQSVEFLGKVSDEMKLALYQEAWVFVNPSFREGWGITTIEANACGTPVVASRVSGLIDSVKNPHTGYLVTYGNVDEFAQYITDLIQDNEKRIEMSAEARKWAEEFSWQKSAKKALEVLFV